MRKRIFILLLLNPLLLVIQFGLGVAVYNKIQNLNTYRHEELLQRRYLRFNQLELLQAQTSQNDYLLTADTAYLQKLGRICERISNRPDTVEFLDGNHKLAIISLTRSGLAMMEQNIRFYEAGQHDSLITGIAAGRTLVDSVNALNEAYYQMLNGQFERLKGSEASWIRLVTSLFVFTFVFNIVYFYISFSWVKTELKRLDGLNRELEARNTQLDTFTYMTYHNLKEPLRHIAGFLQLLQRRNGSSIDKEGQEYIQKSVDATKKLYDIINDLREKYLKLFDKKD
jgi:CHASE3 domain sensor protein